MAAASGVIASGLVGVTAVPAAAVAQTLYVTPDGSTSSDCGQSTPCSLARAKERVQAINDSMSGDIIVQLGGGTYRLTSPLSFTAADSGLDSSNMVRWQAAPNATPIISGGTAVNGTWTEAGGTYSADLTSLGDAALDSRQLYVDGVRATRGSVASSTLGTWDPTDTGYDVTSTAPQSWANPTDVEFVYDGPSGASGGWTASRCRVASVDDITGGSRITMAQPCFTNASLTWPHVSTPTSIEGTGSAALDQDGEWHLDRSAKKLFYRPRTGDNLAPGGSQVELATADGLLTAKGLSYVQFSGLTFEYGTWLGASAPTGVVDIQANMLTTDYAGNPDLKADDRNPAVTYTGSGWTPQVGVSGQYADSQTFTAANGSSLTFTFIGTGFDYLSAMGANRGAFTYKVDNGAPQIGTCYSTITANQQTCLSLTGLAAASHTVTITKTGGSYLSFDAYRVTDGSGATTYDDTPITYTGQWTAQTGVSGQYLGTQTFATANGASFSHTFWGTGLDYISTMAPNRGAFTYSIDGGPAQNGTCQAAGVLYEQVCLSIRDLLNGQHTITFTKTTGTYMSVDALVKRMPRTFQLPGTLAFHASSNIVFEGNTLRHLGGGGISVDEASTNATVRGNVITDISGGGITIGEGTYLPTNGYGYAPPRYVENNALVTNNYVGDTGREFLGSVAILAGWVKNTTISHNDVIRAPYTGISVGWGWGNTGLSPVMVNNHVDFNYVRDVEQSVVTDGGGIYINGHHQASPRSSVEGNYVDGVGHPYGAIYLDNGASNFDVKKNVITNHRDPATGVIQGHGAIFLTSGTWGVKTYSFDNSVTDNYMSITTKNIYNPGGSNNTLSGNTWNLATWPAAARSIISSSGVTSSATATSQWSGNYGPEKAIDGDTVTIYSSNNDNVADHWQVDLGVQRALSAAEIVFRSDLDYPSERQNLEVWVSNDATMATKTIACTYGAGNPAPFGGSLTCSIPAGTWRFLRVRKLDTTGLNFAEVRVLK